MTSNFIKFKENYLRKDSITAISMYQQTVRAYDPEKVQAHDPYRPVDYTGCWVLVVSNSQMTISEEFGDSKETCEARLNMILAELG